MSSRRDYTRTYTCPDIADISPDLKGFHLHDLRHHRISELLAAGVSPTLVARHVGHTSLQQLETYAHLEVAAVAAVLSRLELSSSRGAGEVRPLDPRGAGGALK